MEKEFIEAQEAVQKLLRVVDALKNIEIISGIKPKYSIGQKVFIVDENKIPTRWYSMPVYVDTLEDGFEEIEIKAIKIGKNKDLGYKSCAKLGVAYEYGWNKVVEEQKVWSSIKDAVLTNRKRFIIEKEKYKSELEVEKIRKIEKLKQDLNKLNS